MYVSIILCYWPNMWILAFPARSTSLMFVAAAIPLINYPSVITSALVYTISNLHSLLISTLRRHPDLNVSALIQDEHIAEVEWVTAEVHLKLSDWLEGSWRRLIAAHNCLTCLTRTFRLPFTWNSRGSHLGSPTCLNPLSCPPFIYLSDKRGKINMYRSSWRKPLKPHLIPLRNKLRNWGLSWSWTWETNKSAVD